MADWVVDVSGDPLRFPVVEHRHANGTLRAERDRTPDVSAGADGWRVERWAYACACGDVFTWERHPGRPTRGGTGERDR
jgi:hypothetical protein